MPGVAGLHMELPGRRACPGGHCTPGVGSVIPGVELPGTPGVVLPGMRGVGAPGVLGVVRDATGSYTAPLLICAALDIIAAALVVLRPKPQPAFI